MINFMPTGKVEENTVVLVMDRGGEDVQLITSLLEKTGFHVVQSANAADIVDLCRGANNPVQLIIVDTGTPGIQIPELLNHVQETDPKMRILLISDEKESDLIRHWPVTSNVRGHLSRPFRRAQFLGWVLEAAKQPLVRTA
jgi:CheY-like chemotaxis protein